MTAGKEQDDVTFPLHCAPTNKGARRCAANDVRFHSISTILVHTGANSLAFSNVCGRSRGASVQNSPGHFVFFCKIPLSPLRSPTSVLCLGPPNASFFARPPVCFDPDPEKRALACLGVVQRLFAHQPSPVKALWHEVYFDAVERFKNSPKWLKIGQAMASEQQRPWPYREVDTAVISLWPLLNRHNWTYRDLMNVVRSLISRPDAYPCEREQDFTVHCRTVLGLRKTSRGKSSKDGRPPGHQIASELFRAALGGHTSLRPQT